MSRISHSAILGSMSKYHLILLSEGTGILVAVSNCSQLVNSRHHLHLWSLVPAQFLESHYKS